MSYTNWLVSKLNASEEQQEIASAVALNESLIEVHTKNGKTITVGAIFSNRNITSHDVHAVYTSGAKTPNIVIAKHRTIWRGSTIDYARQQNMGWGGMGEISASFHTNNYADIQRREYSFVEAGLLKHTRVTRLGRI